ncbi:MAG: FecR domain-containing protein [Verrucomicrobiota bacterium]
MNSESFANRRETEDAAARWLARRDRGLSPAEQVEFARWIAVSAHAEALGEIEGPFAALDRATQLRPIGKGLPDPDLLLKRATVRENAARESRRANGRPVRRLWWLGVGTAVAAAIAVGVFYLGSPSAVPQSPSARGVVVRHEPERLTLPDGSRVEMKRGTVLETAFSAHERRVRLRSGEAFFAVVKDSARPFIVDAEKVAVQAVGTAFIVSASSSEVEVVVTEGRVRVDDAEGKTLIGAAPGATTATPTPLSASPASTLPAAQMAIARGLDAGQRLVIATDAPALAPVPVLEATPAVIDRVSTWRKVWLEFGEMRLTDVVEEFNRVAREQGGAPLRLADEATGLVLVSGTFRVDGVEAFVRVLQTTFGIQASAAPDGATLLRKS